MFTRSIFCVALIPEDRVVSINDRRCVTPKVLPIANGITRAAQNISTIRVPSWGADKSIVFRLCFAYRYDSAAFCLTCVIYIELRSRLCERLFFLEIISEVDSIAAFFPFPLTYFCGHIEHIGKAARYRFSLLRCFIRTRCLQTRCRNIRVRLTSDV